MQNPKEQHVVLLCYCIISIFPSPDLRIVVRCACVFFNVLSGLVNGYDICITTGILDFMDRDLALCHDDAELSTCFLKDSIASFPSLSENMLDRFL